MRKMVTIAVAAGALVALAVLGAGAFAASPGKHAGQGWARVASGSAASSAAAAAAADTNGTEHLVFFARTAREDFVDVGASGESTGDSVFFEDVVWNASRTARVGKDSVECRLGIRTFNCAGTLLIFGKGKLQVDGAFFADRDSVIPVTGGTGTFAGAGGQMVVTDISANTTRYDIFLER
jgi:hypothetical protein